jgi:TonB-dependent receptor
MILKFNRRTRFACGASLASLALVASVAPARAGDGAADQAALNAQAQSALLAAQAQGAALLSGRVTDESGAALPGARVLIRELGVEATTNFQGEFLLPAGAGGTLTVEIEYLGFPSLTQSVAVAEAGRTPVSLILSRGADIIVNGSIVSGTARALNQQRQADNLTNIVSADDIGRFPDPNIAEALQRVPGIGVERDQGEGRYINIRGAPAEFTAVSVDGITLTSPDPSTRAIDLDTIPSDIVANLEVSKTLLPWQGADSIAGAVNVVTRSPFDARGFRVSGMAGLSHNQTGGSDRRASGFLSNVFGPDQQFGALLSGSYSRTDRRVDNIESAWEILDTPEGGEVFGISENLFKDYDTRRERIALTGALEFRPSPAHRVFVRGSYARFEDDEYRNRLSILWAEGVLQPGATDRTATFRNTRIEKQFRHRVQRNEIYTLTGGAEHDIGQARLDWNLGYTRSDQTYPRRNELLWRSSLRPTLSYDYSDPDQPFISLFDSNEHLQEERFAFRENTFRQNDTRNNEWSAGANLELPTNVGGVDVTWRVGGGYRSRDVVADEERFRDRRASANPGVPMTDFLSDTISDNYDYLLGRKFDPRRVSTYLDGVRPQSERRMPQSITADYEASEDILGLYGSARIDLGATDIIAGVRMEHTDFTGTAPTFNETTGAIGEARAVSKYTSWFPNLTVRHAFTPDLIGRFALSRGINRPNFIELVPRTVENTESATVRVTTGNPALRPTLSNNADIGIEYYLRPLGVISANAFYKDLSDYRYTLTRTGTYGGQPALLTRPENAPEGRLYGFEVNWQQQFGFLPGLLSGFGIFANYTWTDSKIELSESYAGRSVFPLPGQSRHMWNLSLFYERGPFNARVAYTKRSDYLDEINADDGRFDLFWEGRGQLDFTTSYQLNRNVGLFLEAKNLTNTPGVRYFGDRNRVYEYEKFGYNVFAGIRVNF